jgi:hypothetical protein
MTLATHAVVGAAVSRFFPIHPVVGFFAAFLSHFLVDAIPHGHYKLLSLKHDPENQLADDMTLDKNFILDLMRTGSDFLVGIALSFLLFQDFILPLDWTILIGVVGGVLPDALQLAYWKIRREPLTSLQKFHIWMHTEKRFDGRIFITVLVELATITLVSFLVIQLA